jgi:hypothetical protein
MIVVHERVEERRVASVSPYTHSGTRFAMLTILLIVVIVLLLAGGGIGLSRRG